MKPSLLLCALIAAASPPAAAWASPQFDLFKSFCLDTRADRAKALAAAEAAGWTPVPDELAKQMGGGGESEIVNPQGRMTTTREGLRIMMVGDAKEVAPKTSRQGMFCAVFLQVGDLDALKADAARFAAVPRDPAIVDDKDAAAFAWRESAAGHVQVSAKDLQKAGWDPTVSIVIAGSAGSSPIIALAVPTK